ncbi:unnamed protein product [Aureobasidium vineae]|uniref:Uncharacterized protein n=1 Tax=Aureobasidium vineae TaxID=2773715 RepID=A0A9N8J9T2_9PEZI|nr:unnamed protein product [Aureobasidium vineae]
MTPVELRNGHARKKVHAVKTNAEKLAEDLIKDNKVEQLAEQLVEAYLGLYKLKDSPTGTEAFSGMEEDLSGWAKLIIHRGDVEGIRMSFVYSAVRLWYMQIHIKKLAEDLP